MQIEKQKQLKPYNTFSLPATAKYFARVTTEAELQELVQTKTFQEEEHFILGGGSNTLFAGDFDGIVVLIDIRGVKADKVGEEILLTAGAGEDWHNLVTTAVTKGWGGLENLALIPGSTGAAPVQNIGAYGVELDQIFASLTAVDLETGEIRKFNKQACQFGYRDSIFKQELKNKFAITSVTFTLAEKHSINKAYGDIEKTLAAKNIKDATIKDIYEAVIAIRNSKLPDPKEIGTAGSFFKNPIISKQLLAEIRNDYPEVVFYEVNNDSVKIPAGWLIDQAGWKGWTSENGKYGVHEKHALVIVNYGGASGDNILSLAEDIQESVKDKFSVILEPEVNVIR
jgi:UDP-N-acetylmuramate dehydrogenase